MNLRAGAGRPPNENREATRNRAALKGWVEVPNRPFTEGRSHHLPTPPRAFDGRWPEQTEEWWETLRTMPHAALWSDQDWLFATETALIHAWFWSGDLSKATELRIRERIMGMTEESRRGMHIKYVDVPTELTSVSTSVIPMDIRKPLARKTRVRAMDPEAK